MASARRSVANRMVHGQIGPVVHAHLVRVGGFAAGLEQSAEPMGDDAEDRRHFVASFLGNVISFQLFSAF